MSSDRFFVYINWVAGIFLALLGLVALFDNQIGLGLLLLVLASVILPPSENKLFEILKIKRFKYAKTIAFVLGFVLFGNSNEPDNIKQAETAQTPIIENSQQTENQTKAVEDPLENAKVEVIEKVEEQKKLYNVTKVVDGDTVEVEIDGQKEVLRLIGINTPETVDPRKPVECFGKEASARAKEILEGKKVMLEADPTQGELDKYNRLLRYVILEDGASFNKMMIEEGYAYEYTYNTPYKYQEEFKAAQKKAEAEKMGLWADDTCSGNLTKPTVSNQSELAPPVKAVESKPASTGSFSCSGKKTCGEMKPCQEAYFYLNNCGVKSLDRDKDGIPCETICN